MNTKIVIECHKILKRKKEAVWLCKRIYSIYFTSFILVQTDTTEIKRDRREREREREREKKREKERKRERERKREGEDRGKRKRRVE